MVGGTKSSGRSTDDIKLFHGMREPCFPGRCEVCHKDRMLVGKLRKPWGKGYRWYESCEPCIEDRVKKNIDPFLFKGRPRMDGGLVRRIHIPYTNTHIDTNGMADK